MAHKKTYWELDDKERKKLGKKYAKADGEDGLTIFLYVVIALALCFSVTFGVCGFLFMGDGEIWLISGIIGCATTVFLVVSIFLVRLWRKKRLDKNKNNLKLLLENYSKDTLDECRDFRRREHWLYGMFYQGSQQSDDPIVNALRNAAISATFKHSSSSSYTPSSSSSSSNTTRVKLKDGSELHTEDRFGDYKTYLYDKDGKNTGLHVQGDRVLDNNWNEVGSFDSSGKFNPKN